MKFVYLDTCAALKLFKEETRSRELIEWLTYEESAEQITSNLTRTELKRALHAVSAQRDTLNNADMWLQRCAKLALSPHICDVAGDIQPGARLRSLDALHLCSALLLGDTLRYFVTYDKHLVLAAEEHNLPVISP